MLHTGLKQLNEQIYSYRNFDFVKKMYADCDTKFIIILVWSVLPHYLLESEKTTNFK